MYPHIIRISALEVVWGTSHGSLQSACFIIEAPGTPPIDSAELAHLYVLVCRTSYIQKKQQVSIADTVL